ncbi:hypothetical protein HD554DRAFT_2238328 [Boletus coccyginus]|nr:hypothetical protein HD554DRAFT_2238328 [Boletus coccyginus]
MSSPAILDQTVALHPRLASAGPKCEQSRQMVYRRFSMASRKLIYFTTKHVESRGTATGGTGATNPTSPSSITPYGAAGTSASVGAGAIPYNPSLLQALLGGVAFGGDFSGAPMVSVAWAVSSGGLFGAPPAAVPTYSRPPEERFRSTAPGPSHARVPSFRPSYPVLFNQQLQDMDFAHAAQNVRAILATNGNVRAMIEYILGGGGL